MSEQEPRWEQPGYGDIIAARVAGDLLQVEFGNGDIALLPPSSLGLEIPLGQETRVEDGLAIRFGDTVISWMAIRSATDPIYSAHLRELETAESRRIGNRLKVLREDREVSQSQLASALGMTARQLSRIEGGLESINFSTIRQIVRELGASIADITGPDAPEISLATIIKRATAAGVPRKLVIALVKAVRRNDVPEFLAQAFSWGMESLLVGVPQSPALPVAIQFKAPNGYRPGPSPLVHLALSTARIAHTAVNLPRYAAVPSDPASIRSEALDSEGRITLASLLDWTWRRGVAVLPLIGKGEFTAAVLQVGQSPTIVIKESRDLAVWWLFDLAHELGHIGLGHVQNAIVDVHSPTNPTVSDAQERAATSFALELLLPNHKALLDAVRVDARGDRVRFKFSVERVAERAGVSPGLLGVVAAFALSDVGRPLDRWGSATNLARPEGSGREIVRNVARRYTVFNQVSALDAALIGTTVLGEEVG